MEKQELIVYKNGKINGIYDIQPEDTVDDIKKVKDAMIEVRMLADSKSVYDWAIKRSVYREGL